jgi:hypothetical protein
VTPSIYRRFTQLPAFLAQLALRDPALASWPVRRSIVRRPNQVVTLFTAMARGSGRPHPLVIYWFEVPDAEEALLDGSAAEAELQIRLAGFEIEEGEWTVGDLRVLEPLVCGGDRGAGSSAKPAKDE